jgi:hypothetical protein
MPAFAAISSALGIRWCALTDEDRLEDGTINPVTEKHRKKVDEWKSTADNLVQWAINLERSLNILAGKAKPEVTAQKLTRPDWRARYPDFASTVSQIAKWVDPTLTV